MEFDPSTATLLEDKATDSGFDPSTAQPLDEPSRVDGVKSWLSTAMKFPAKFGMATANLSGTGMFRWPTDQEVETPLVSPEQMKTVMPYAYVADAAKQMFPESKTAQVAAGLTGGLTETASGLTSPENAAMLGVAPEGKLAQRLVAGTFLGQSLLGTPEQWEAFKNAPELTDKIRIATTMGLGIALPTAGLAHSFRESPKVVEPVRTTEEAGKAADLFPESVPQVESRQLNEGIESETQRIPKTDDQNTPRTLVTEVSRLPEQPVQERPQPDPNIPSVEEARPKTTGDVFDQVSAAPIKEASPESVDVSGQNVLNEVVPNEQQSAPTRIPAKVTDLTEDQFAQLADEFQAARKEANKIRSWPAYEMRLRDQIGKEGVQERLQRFADLRNDFQRVGGFKGKRFQEGSMGYLDSQQVTERTVDADWARKFYRQQAPSVLERTEEHVPPPVSQKIEGIKETESELVRPTGQNEPTPTSTKNAVTEAEREARGIQPAEQTAKREFGTVWDEAEAVTAKDADAPRRLVDEIAANPRALTDKENALLLRRQIEVQNEHDAAVKAVNEATDDASRMDATARLERVRDDLQAVYDAAKVAGTETGRGLNARKMLANDDFSLAKMEATTRAVVNDGKPLTPKQAADVAALHERIKVAERKLAEYETREKFNDLIRDAQKEARARKASGKTHQSFLEERAAKARERIKEMPGVCAL